MLTGSTRMKSGTAQKMILNMISTASMVADRQGLSESDGGCDADQRKAARAGRKHRHRCHRRGAAGSAQGHRCGRGGASSAPSPCCWPAAGQRKPPAASNRPTAMCGPPSRDDCGQCGVSRLSNKTMRIKKEDKAMTNEELVRQSAGKPGRQTECRLCHQLHDPTADRGQGLQARSTRKPSRRSRGVLGVVHDRPGYVEIVVGPGKCRKCADICRSMGIPAAGSADTKKRLAGQQGRQSRRVRSRARSRVCSRPSETSLCPCCLASSRPACARVWLP